MWLRSLNHSNIQNKIQRAVWCLFSDHVTITSSKTDKYICTSLGAFHAVEIICSAVKYWLMNHTSTHSLDLYNNDNFWRKLGRSKCFDSEVLTTETNSLNLVFLCLCLFQLSQQMSPEGRTLQRSAGAVPQSYRNLRTGNSCSPPPLQSLL